MARVAQKESSVEFGPEARKDNDVFNALNLNLQSQFDDPVGRDLVEFAGIE